MLVRSLSGGKAPEAPQPPAAPVPAASLAQHRVVKEATLLMQQDVEAQEPKIEELSDASAANASSPNSPVFLAKMIFRKAAVLFLSSSPRGIITTMKDIIVGVILGALTISFLVFLDHHDVIHLESAHNFRNAAFNLLNDPETILSLEESSDLKFITFQEYESKRKEIDGVEERIANLKTILEAQMEEVESKWKEIEAIKLAYDAAYHDPILKLDKYCGGCRWGQKFSCDARVNFLIRHYNTKPIKAKMSAMTRPTCVKK